MSLLDLFVKIGVDDQASDKVSSLSQKLGNGLATAAKVGVAALAAASTGVAALAKSAVSAYADFEQLEGGVETLFKDSSDTVLAYARQAYQTAGLSANEYMETVTSFSASLLQSLGGDTAEAARVADMAITDMSDNANKMGTSMQSIQAAYQGFAKQNYTMLDNLKLGYGGTKTEMERLLRDAEAFEAQQGRYVSFSIESYADIANAIHVVQENLGIAGTTALEARETIAGSLAAMRSAWANLKAGIADENADIGALVDKFVDSAGVAAENLVPRIEKAIGGISRLVTDAATTIVPIATQTILDSAPMLVSAGFDLLMSLILGIVDNTDKIVDTALTLVLTLVDGLIDNFPKIVEGGVKLVVQLGVGLIKALPELAARVPELIETILTGLYNGIQQLLEFGADLVDAIWSGVKSKAAELVKNVTAFFRDIFEAARTGAEIGSGLSYGGVAKTTSGGASGGASGGGGGGGDVTLTLDGEVLARTSYGYNQREGARQGVALAGPR